MIINTSGFESNEILFKNMNDNSQNINTMLDNINRTFKLNPSYFQVNKIINRMLDNNIYDTWLIDENSYKLDNGKKKIIMKPSQDLNRGEIVVVPKWDNQKWLVTKIDPQTLYYNTGIIEYCNFTLSWQDEDKNTIQQFCVVQNLMRTSLGVDLNPTMQILEAKMIILLPLDSNTAKLNINKRIMLKGQDVYKVTHRDLTTRDGIVELVLKQDMYNPATDSAEKMICDYYGNAHDYTINFLNNNSSIQVGNTLQIQANLLDDGNIVGDNTNNIISTWTYVSNNLDIISVDENGLITSLSAGSGSITIGCEGITSTYDIQVTAILVADNFACTISGVTSAKLSSVQTYNAIFTNNGNPITDSATWSLMNNDETMTPTTYASIQSTTDDTCTIKITSDYIFGDGAKYVRVYVHGSIATDNVYLKVKLNM
jgi:hypothetical protein